MPALTTGHKTNYYTPGQIRLMMLERTPYCEICGCSDKIKLVVHHKVPRRAVLREKNNHSVENLQVLCKSCHAQIHKKMRLEKRNCVFDKSKPCKVCKKNICCFDCLKFINYHEGICKDRCERAIKALVNCEKKKA